MTEYDKKVDLETLGHIWKVICATLKHTNDDDLLINLKILRPDPEGL